MDAAEEPELAVYHRHLKRLLSSGDRETFRALMAQARHIVNRSYETSLYDHQQTFRLLWHHLDHVGHLSRMSQDARSRLASGRASAEESEELELFLTLYRRITTTDTDDRGPSGSGRRR
ncbi:hypothetical protein [Streptomyces sp. NPDC096323]|uniref:hypothetical protein n=1 Tax=Streptomyces sp. NPDC096323 TaxID=3155822 RepID=UPI00332E3213